MMPAAGAKNLLQDQDVASAVIIMMTFLLQWFHCDLLSRDHRTKKKEKEDGLLFLAAQKTGPNNVPAIKHRTKRFLEVGSNNKLQTPAA
jgi:hypothetical protein